MATTEKKQRLGLVKSIDTIKKSVVAHVSTFGWDRMGERFEKGAWDLGNYKNNPVVLWSHDPTTPPIGKAIRLSEDDEGLFAEAQFDDQNEFAMKIFGLFERGFLNAFSVGFIPKKFMYENISATTDRGLVYLEAELLEFSAVSIPANPGAVISREMGELVLKTLGETAVSPVEMNGVKGFLVKAIEFDGEKKTDAPAQGEPDPTKPAEPVEPAAGETPATPPAEPTAGEVAPPAAEPTEPPAAGEPAPAETTKSLAGLLELAKMAKGMKLDKSTVGMLGAAVTVFQEIISENSESVSREDFESLKSSVAGLGEVVKNLYPDVAETVRKIMFQVEKAIKVKAS